MNEEVTPEISRIPLEDKPHSSMLRTLGMIFLGIIIFGSGIIVGAAGTVKFIERKLKTHLEHPEEAPDKILPNIAKTLKLTPDQINKIDPIIRKHHAELMEIRKEISPRIAREFQEIETDVNSILDERQQKIWKNWFDKVRWFWLPRVEEMQKQK